MFRGFVKAAAAFVVVVILSYPFTHEMFARESIRHDVINALDVNDAAALKNWPGSAVSFLDMLYERCLRTHGRDAASCVRYQPRG
jgi:hypothetical protein